MGPSERPRHCMVVHARYPLGETRVERQVDALVSAGYQVDVICLRGPAEPSHEDSEHVRIRRLPVRRKKDRPPLAQLVEYARFAVLATMVLTRRARRYRTVQIHNPPDALVLVALPCRLFGARVILDIHDVTPEFAQERFGLDANHPVIRAIAGIEQLSSRLAHHVVTVSPHWREALIGRGLAPDRCSVVPNLPGRRILDARVERSRRDDGRPLRLWYHGTITSRYGLDRAIEAVAILRDRGHDVEFTIHGGGAVEPLRRLAADLDLGPRVLFDIGLVPTDELARRMAHVDIGVVPYRDDVFTGTIVPTKLLEYAFFDIPTVASRTVGITSIFDESTAVLVEPNDPVALADGIERLVMDPSERGRVRRGLVRWRAEHDPERIAEEYVTLISDLSRPTPNHEHWRA